MTRLISMTHADVLDCCNADARTNVINNGCKEEEMKFGRITVQDAINMEMEERLWEKRGEFAMSDEEYYRRLTWGQV